MQKRQTVKWHILLFSAVVLLMAVAAVCPEAESHEGGKLLYFTVGYQKKAPAFTNCLYPDSLSRRPARIVAYLPTADAAGTGETFAVLPECGKNVQTDSQPACTKSDNPSGFVSTNKKVFYLLI
ncbi:MAG: hypothetical protein E7409_01995 [Ruminococcaceae bacterium]|nr:hypothetical protein [Oscillospiraceae bacterium]